jgi:hypothetical protein
MRLTLPVPSAANAAIGARKGRTAAGTASFFRKDESIFIDYECANSRASVRFI